MDRPEDKLDPRQYILATIQGEEDSTPVEFMDLMKNMSAVIRQNFGSCTAQGTDAIKEFQEQKLLSQYFIYVMSKKISGIYDQEGEYLVNPLKAVCKYGVPEEKFMPDVKPLSGKWIDYVKKEPSKEAYENALKHLGKTYWRVNMGAINFRNAIWKNRTPVIFAMKWYDNYNRCPQSGILPAPDRLVGYHAVCGVGWDKTGLWVKNSFGEQWGHNGYLKILFSKWDVVQPYACYVLLDKKKTMKLIGDNLNKKDLYAIGEDGKIRLIYNLTTLGEGHKAGMWNKDQKIDWIDGIMVKYERGKDIIFLENE